VVKTYNTRDPYVIVKIGIERFMAGKREWIGSLKTQPLPRVASSCASIKKTKVKAVASKKPNAITTVFHCSFIISL
jgi:hypothetical protein